MCPIKVADAIININFGNLMYVSTKDALIDTVLGTTKQQELSKALELNRQKLFLTPYYMTALRLLPNTEKNKHADLGADKFGSLEYAGGILMRDQLPAVVANHILGFLPLIRSRQGKLQTNNFLNIAKEHHPEGLKIKENKNWYASEITHLHKYC